MAIKQLNLSLNGNNQVLTGGLAASVGDPPIKQLGVQGNYANANPFYVGDSALNTTTESYLLEYPATVSSIPGAPLVIDFPKDSVVRLSELYVKGTSGQKVHGWIVY